MPPAPPTPDPRSPPRVSDDKGATLTAVRTTWRGIGIRSIKLHPWHDNWLLVLVKRPDCKSPDRALMECPHDLMLNTVGVGVGVGRVNRRISENVGG